MQGYSPFDKPLDQLRAADLVTLRQVPEGWYVEYKRDFPGIHSAAKSLSAFANSYGGWLFYGIAESDDGERKAGSFSGLPVSELPRIEQALRQAASTHVAPPPYFETHAVRGPHDAIGLTGDRAVLIVHVPQGSNAPFVHASGRVYRRVADASDPTHETDRHFLDLLWRRGKATRRAFSKFVRQRPETSEAERDVSYVKLFIFPDPWGERNIMSRLDFDGFATLMADESAESGGLPFDNIFTTSTGFVARQTRNNNPALQIFTWRYNFDCTSEITIPLNHAYLESVASAYTFLDGYEQRDDFVRLLTNRALTSVHLIDLSHLFAVLVSVLKRQSRLMDAEQLTWPLFYKAHITHVWRRVPFIDMPELIHFGERHGLPVVQDERCFAPSGTEPDTCGELRDHQDDEIDWEVARMINGGVVFVSICQALGLPDRAVGFHPDSEPDTVIRAMDMGRRAMEVTRQRSGQHPT